jgi:hypothetical protein
MKRFSSGALMAGVVVCVQLARLEFANKYTREIENMLHFSLAIFIISVS